MKNILLSFVLLLSSFCTLATVEEDKTTRNNNYIWGDGIFNGGLIKGFLSKEECTICQEEISHKTALSCKHLFCQKCIFIWFQTNPSCPICRCDQTTFYKFKLLNSDNPNYEENQIIQSENNISNIVLLLRSVDPRERRRALRTLMTLACNDSDNLSEIRKAGALTHLIALLESENEDIFTKQVASQILFVVCENENRKIEIIFLSGISFIAIGFFIVSLYM